MLNTPTVGLVDSLFPGCREALEKIGFTVYDFAPLTESLCREKIKDVDAIVVRSRFPFDAKFMAQNQHLKCIARWGSGLENIDLEAAKMHGIRVVNAPEGNCQAVGEHALLLLLSLLRNMPRIDQEVRQGIWLREANRGTELRGKTVGIVGYGNTGSAFARILGGFNVKVLAYDKYRRGFSDDHIREAKMEEIYRHSDVLSLHLPLTVETENFFNREMLNAFKKPIYFLNTARGSLVEGDTLLYGLDTGKIIGAGLDVLPFEKPTFEHLADHPKLKSFIQHPRMVFSPHIAGWTYEANIKTAKIISMRIEEAVLGKGIG
ncbi:MAG: hypothetical protein JJU02_04565 [Cryomorphaceae bacterium]|nr:hypothetical protein [Cryomorphaceae bacterium]